MKPIQVAVLLGVALLAGSSCKLWRRGQDFVALFPEDGTPKGWIVRNWANVKDPHPDGGTWKVENGILHGSVPRGTWLISPKEYDNFILEFEFLLPEQGNSGCGLRFPLEGDPAFDGIELQMVDPRYYGAQQVPPSELTGSLYRAVAPDAQAYRPGEWNRYEVACAGGTIRVVLNGIHVLDVDLEEQNQPVRRHDGTEAQPLRQRPRRGHIGFQELSRGGGHVQIRNARIKEIKLKGPE